MEFQFNLCAVILRSTTGDEKSIGLAENVVKCGDSVFACDQMSSGDECGRRCELDT